MKDKDVVGAYADDDEDDWHVDGGEVLYLEDMRVDNRCQKHT